MLLPFLLFLIGGLRLKDELTPQMKLIWLYPLLMIVFVTLNMIKIPWGFIERFYFPALPALAMLAPQFLRFEWPRNVREKLGFGLLLAAAGALILLMRAWLMRYAGSMDIDYGRILDSLYYPVVLSILLAVVIGFKRFKWFSAVIPLFCIGAMLLSPLMYSYKYFYRIPKIQERYDELMYPFEEFSEDLEISSDDRLFISPSLDWEKSMLSDDPNDIVGMYNFHFDARISESNVLMGYTPETLTKYLTTRNVSHALLTQEDWIWLEENTDVEALKSLYRVKFDSLGKITLLIHE